MITALVDGLFGSCGKGLVAGHLAGAYPIHVRVGAANAGHTVYVQGQRFVVQQLPCAAYANPWAKLVLGAGAMISPTILEREIEANLRWRRERDLPGLQLYVDERAHAVTEHHVEQEHLWGLAERIGSTSAVAREGIGAAQAARVARTRYEHALDAMGYTPGVVWCDTVSLLHGAKAFNNILLEGTQGTGLDNVLGYTYPYVTSRSVVAAGLAADCGLGPRDIDTVLLVIRTHAIRVAGPSGPFWPDSREIDWADLGVDPQQERTTVTQKVRRVATLSYQQVKYAARVNSATEIALTFIDYLAPEYAGRSGVISAPECQRIDRVGPMIQEIEAATGLPVTLLGTGPQTLLEREPPVDGRGPGAESSSVHRPGEDARAH